MSEDQKAENKQLLVALAVDKTSGNDYVRAVRKEIIAAILAEDPELVKWFRTVLKVYA